MPLASRLKDEGFSSAYSSYRLSNRDSNWGYLLGRCLSSYRVVLCSDMEIFSEKKVNWKSLENKLPEILIFFSKTGFNCINYPEKRGKKLVKIEWDFRVAWMFIIVFSIVRLPSMVEAETETELSAGIGLACNAKSL